MCIHQSKGFRGYTHTVTTASYHHQSFSLRPHSKPQSPEEWVPNMDTLPALRKHGINRTLQKAQGFWDTALGGKINILHACVHVHVQTDVCAVSHICT